MKINIIIIVIFLALASCSSIPGAPDPDETAPPLPDYGEAPELSGDIWLNIETPLRLKDLRGQVIILDMWTFG